MSDTKKNYKQHESWANISLLFAAVLFFVTLYAAAKNPGNIFLEGLHFAVDAALVGAIADWFAVTAIFNLIGREIPHFYKWWDESPLFIS